MHGGDATAELARQSKATKSHQCQRLGHLYATRLRLEPGAPGQVVVRAGQFVGVEAAARIDQIGQHGAASVKRIAIRCSDDTRHRASLSGRGQKRLALLVRAKVGGDPRVSIDQPVMACVEQVPRHRAAELGVVETRPHKHRATGLAVRHLDDRCTGRHGRMQHRQCRGSVVAPGDGQRIRHPAEHGTDLLLFTLL